MRKKGAVLSQDELKRRVEYNPETGEFLWRESYWPKLIGAKAGSRHSAGYISICINRAHYLAHRLAWLYMHGRWPVEIDHIDRDRSNNRITNLRECTRAQNNSNCSSKGSVGLKGVTKVKAGYQAQISIENRMKYLGFFKTPEEASAAYLAEARRLRGDFASAV